RRMVARRGAPDRLHPHHAIDSLLRQRRGLRARPHAREERAHDPAPGGVTATLACRGKTPYLRGLMPIDPDSADPDLLGRIPLAAASGLEIGCGTGGPAAAYKRRNPKARYVGIEADPAAAEIAAGRMDAVAAVDVEQEPLPFPGETYDCIVYGGVLN